MSTRYLRGTYASGYTLTGVYSAVTIGPTALIDGTGLTGGTNQSYEIVNLGGVAASTASVSGILLQAGGTIANGSTSNTTASIAGGASAAGIELSEGGSIGNWGTVSGGGGDFGRLFGGSGGDAIVLSTGGNIENWGAINGGGAGGSYFNAGGRGGDGVVLPGGGSIDNHGTIVAGAGGSSYFRGGGAGVGIVLSGGGDIANTGLISGGAGGGGAGEVAGSGGAGGTGTVLSDGGSIENLGTVAGGTGGNSYFTGGGSGGSGIMLSTSGSISNRGTIIGGAGGDCAGGHGGIGPFLGGGAGGDGIVLSSGGGIENHGMIAGGAGGRDNRYFVGGGGGGPGGSGVVLAVGGSIQNLGTITGGIGGTGTPTGAAGAGVLMAAGGVVVNGSASSSTPLIAGATGIVLFGTAGATVTNFGTIASTYGTSGTALKLLNESDLLVLEEGGRLVGAISGFSRGDAIDLPGLVFHNGGTATLAPGNTLHIAESGSSIDLQLDPTDDFNGDTFTLTADARGGTLVGVQAGGQFVFGASKSFAPLASATLGINDGIQSVFPLPLPNTLNIEVFTSVLPANLLPSLDAGFQAGAILRGGFIGTSPANYLVGGLLQLFAGDYIVVDASNGSNISAEIILGSGNQTVVGAAGDTLVGGSGNQVLFGASGDSMVGGSGSTYVEGEAGGMRIQIGAAGAADVIGSTVTGSGDTIVGGSRSLNYNPGAGGGHDLIDLSGSTGNSTVNAFSTNGTEFAHVNDTIVASNGGTFVWGGDGDRIGVGNGPTVAGSHLWGHSTTVPGAAVGFGTNDTVTATIYDTVGQTWSINSTVAGSSAQVTIGGAAGTFDTTDDFLFYANESAATNSAIVATAQSIDGGASSRIALPDGTMMTLLGVTQSQLQAALSAGTLFRT